MKLCKPSASPDSIDWSIAHNVLRPLPLDLPLATNGACTSLDLSDPLVRHDPVETINMFANHTYNLLPGPDLTRRSRLANNLL